MCASLCGCLMLSKDVPVIREWSPLYVMITVIVVMSEKVDTTITKGESCLVLLGVKGSSDEGLLIVKASLETCTYELGDLS